MSVSSIQGNYLSGLKTGGLNPDRNATNSISPRTTQMPADRVEINGKKKGLSTTQKCGIGLAVAGTLAAAALLMKGKAGAASKLAEHIDFKQANSIEEAIAFARTELGIKKYSKDMPLEVMNWVNEGLVNVNNAAKGKAIMPRKIKYGRDMRSTRAWCCPSNGGSISINKVHIENMDSSLSKALNNSLEDKFIIKKENGEYVLNQLFDDVSSSYDKILKNIEQFKKNPNSISIADKFGIEQALGTIGNIYRLRFTAGRTTKLPETDKFQTIYHEMGHFQHYNNAGYKVYRQMCKPTEALWDIPSITKDFLLNQEKQQTAKSISKYAAESPLEFVAETYGKLISQALHGGEKLPDDVMKLYAEYKGPVV